MIVLNKYLFTRGLVKCLMLFCCLTVFVTGCNQEHREIEESLPAIRVRVLNGIGFKGIASEMSDYLKRYNIDVIGVGNADKFVYNRTIIVVKHDDEYDLARLMKYTGISRRVYAYSEHSVESFQIVLGHDYRDYIKK
jgi:hypothetical protein